MMGVVSSATFPKVDTDKRTLVPFYSIVPGTKSNQSPPQKGMRYAQYKHQPEGPEPIIGTTRPT